MRAFLIDAAARTITETTYNGDWTTIAPAIDAELFAYVAPSDTLGLYVDDEGLMKAPLHFFMVEGWHEPLPGKGLLLATDVDGEPVDATITLERVTAMVRFLTLNEVIANFG